MFSEEDMKEAEKHDVLGPAYFDARRVARNVMDKFEAEDFKPMVEKVFDTFPNLEITWTWSNEDDGYTMRYSMERHAIVPDDEEAA
jgi:hypothetical protein